MTKLKNSFGRKINNLMLTLRDSRQRSVNNRIAPRLQHEYRGWTHEQIEDELNRKCGLL